MAPMPCSQGRGALGRCLQTSEAEKRFFILSVHGKLHEHLSELWPGFVELEKCGLGKIQSGVRKTGEIFVWSSRDEFF
jgi:hypothetical protein